MRLLYAEDESALSEAVADYLTYHKYIVDAVYDGADAYDYAISGNYDGIILDIMMPKRDGLEVLSELRRNGCKTPVLLLTAKTQVEDRIRGLDTGADDYLSKAACVPRNFFQINHPLVCSVFFILQNSGLCLRHQIGCFYAKKPLTFSGEEL